jgi:hypothetical protein
MPPLTAIERFFERLFERPSARLFRARVQPIQLQRPDRARDGGRTPDDVGPDPRPEPLRRPPQPDDLAEFGDMTASLASELADGALSFARAHRYTVVDRPRVDLLADPTVERTDIRVDARFARQSPGAAGTAQWRSIPNTNPRSMTSTPPRRRVYTVPRPRTHVRRPARDGSGRSYREVVVDGDLTIGRATDNDLVALDGRVSRHHGASPAARHAGLRRPRQHQRVTGQ